MQIILNGEAKIIPEGMNVAELLDFLKQKRSRVAIALNRSVIKRTELDKTKIEEGDRVDIVTAVGGG